VRRYGERRLDEPDPRRPTALDQSEVVAEHDDEVGDVRMDLAARILRPDQLRDQVLAALGILEQEELLLELVQ
jgi:hypothetical protein